MAAAKQNTHSKWRGVFIPLGILILSQLIFYLFEDTWLLNPGYSLVQLEDALLNQGFSQNGSPFIRRQC
ncbi:hypothetical protein JCM19046_668 [Bacillus sp. JCM 19046]|nr:hypothetical protein JCM19045_1102 [Bacillus sp. JCM 19045]GAF16253.1 hypothetical protein JCM19046_668 [Bacillus sp. JCM 19046]